MLKIRLGTNIIPRLKRALSDIFIVLTQTAIFITFAILCSALESTIKIAKTLHNTASASVLDTLMMQTPGVLLTMQ